MSKFTIVVHSPIECHLFCDRGPAIGKHFVERFSLDELPALYSCVGAAMAESKSSKCVCILGRKGWPVCDKPFVDIAAGANACANPINGTICEHDEACHQPQEPSPPTPREGEKRVRLFRKKYPRPGFCENFLAGHITVGPVTIYGENAMHWAVNIDTRWGWLCFRLPLRCFGMWWPLYCYLSPDATPTSATRWFWGKRARGYGVWR